MSFNCFCVRSGAGENLFKVRVQLLDNTVSEYSLSKTSTVEECVRRIADESDLKEIAYFGLKCGSDGTSEKWLSLNENLQKQIQKFKKDSKDELLLYFKIRFFATQLNWLTEDTTRYFYYLQLRENINDGTLSCNEKEAIVLASYALQVEYGDYDPSEHTEEFIEEYQLLPMNLVSSKSNSQLYNEISKKHETYVGMSTTDAEFAYIKYAKKLGCYGHEFYSAKDNEGRPVEIGPCARGISLKYDSETPITYFDWQDIVEMIHSKRLFAVETNTLKSVVEMESPEHAKYVWQMCVDHHQFHRIADHKKKNSVSSELGHTPSQAKRKPVKRHSTDVEISNGFTQANDGHVNPGFNDSALENHEMDAPESKRTSRESGIYGSSGSQVSPLQRVELQNEIYNSEPSTSRYGLDNDIDIPEELMMASYKTFDKAKEKRLNEHIDAMTRRSYPRTVAPRHTTNNDGAGVSRSISMIVPTPPGDTLVDSCSVQTVATSGYSTSTDSGLHNARSPTSPMSPVSLLSSGSFVYEDYEVPSFDEQCKQLEVVVCEGRLDQEFAQIMLKDEKRSTATGQVPINRTRNRYPDILPYEDSRVHLVNSSDSSANDYINASFIKVKVSTKPYNYIATQAPLETTVADFWQMIWEQNVKIIVMLFNKRDDGPLECHRYWPKYRKDSGQTSRILFDKFEVTTQFVNNSGCYKSSGLKLYNKIENKERTIIHLQFLQWPDNGIPSDPTAFLEFISEVDSIRHNFEEEEENISPTVVHCCAGVGRTGVFILAHLMIAYLQNQTRQPFNVARILTKLRSQRMSLVRTVDQYRFVYNLIIHYLKNSRLI